MSDIKYESADQLTNISHIRSLEQPDSTFSSRGENGDTPLVYRTTRLPCNQILTEAPSFLQWLRIITKHLSPSLRFISWHFNFHPPFLPVSFLITVPSVSLLFIYCLFHRPLPPLSLQNTSLQWSGCLTAAPPEEYQSMLLWRQNQTPFFYFPFLLLVLACGCS